MSPASGVAHQEPMSHPSHPSQYQRYVDCRLIFNQILLQSDGLSLTDQTTRLTGHHAATAPITAAGFCYHQAAIFGGLVAPVLSYIATACGVGFGMSMLVGTAVRLVSYCFALLFGPETRGKVPSPSSPSADQRRQGRAPGCQSLSRLVPILDHRDEGGVL